MAIKVIAQRRELKIGKNPGVKKFVMRPDLYIPIAEKKVFAEASTHSGISAGVIKAAWDAAGEVIRTWVHPHPRTGNDALRRALEVGGEVGRCEDGPHHHPQDCVHAQRGGEGGVEEHQHPDHLPRRGGKCVEARHLWRQWRGGRPRERW